MNQTVLLKGAPLAKAVKEQVAAEAKRFHEVGVTPRLAVVLATTDPGAVSYAQSKQKAAGSLGITVELIELGQTTQETLETKLAELGRNDAIHGILLELPLAPGLDSDRAIEVIPPLKDVDGLTAQNIGLAATNREGNALLSATAQACVELAETQGSLSGKRVGLVGRGRTVGRPLLPMLINRHATVTVCHTKTPDLTVTLKPCDIVMVAAGRANLIKGEHLAEGQIVIDAGINVVGDKLVGDVEEASVLGKVKALTPVPGGVGTLTTAIIFRNLLRAIRLQQSRGKTT
jgi:methylenetetrahydrofolate dehydrogenase (NADP+) / methenyltetrahydrofolate cyclohydrolase